MPAYDGLRYDPPAPVAEVVLRDHGSNKSLGGVLLLLDSGADVTLLPRLALDQLGVKPIIGLDYELIGFDGTRHTSPVVELDMIFLQRTFRGRYLIVDAEHGILGRDVLSSLAILLDGPRQNWAVIDT
jgi:hypothetical protein